LSLTKELNLFWRKILKRSLRDTALIVCFLALLLAWNTWLRDAKEALIGTTENPENVPPKAGSIVRVMSINLAKGFFYQKGKRHLEPIDEVKQRLDDTAQLIQQYQADIVFLSEAIWQLPDYHNQITYLAQKSGLHSWAYGEVLNMGLPFFRIQGGNAILSNYPLHTAHNVSLRRLSWFEFGSNRGALFAHFKTEQKDIQLTAIHNDHHDWGINAQQTDVLLNYFQSQTSLIGGDFNVPPDSPSIQKLKNSDLFSGEFNGPATSPSWDDPAITIDFIFAPKSWTLVAHQVIQNPASDHKIVLSSFQLP
jgi:endonuclease/exonuclease/phosphatase family metal-dependent hydrolase